MAFGTGTFLTTGGRGITTGRLIGTGTEPKWVGIGTGATTTARTATAADTALSTAAEARVGGNAGTQTGTLNDTYQVIQTITATAARAVDEAALFDAVTGGAMFMSATFPVVNLAIGDSIQMTMKVQYA